MPAQAAKRPRKTSVQSPAMRQNPNGGLLRTGNPGNIGGGRPKEVVRERMLALGAEKGIPFLSDLLDGKITVDLIGICAQCKSETQMDMTWLESFTSKYVASADLRLRATEQAWKYGLGTQKEVTVDNVRARVQRTLETIQRLAPPELAQQIVTALQPVWS